MNMKVGDLVKYFDSSNESQGRIHGVITQVDMWSPRGVGQKEPIVEVLWNNGPGWILRSRVKVVNENR